MFKITTIAGLAARALPVATKTQAGRKILFRSLKHVALEPSYLDSDEVEIPSYPPLNFQLKAFDYTVLENFSGYIHKTAQKMDIDVEDCWAVPCQKMRVTTFKPSSTKVEHEYDLNINERNVQIVDLPVTTAPIFFSIVQAALPEGVKLNIKPHEAADEAVRYLPDQELRQLQAELASIGTPTGKGGWKKK